MKREQNGLNLLLAVDKPEGISSHDVVNAVRRSLGERRVGHAGTLDPLASGLMIVGVGQATRLMGLITATTKTYIAQIKFGSATSTDDREGEVIRTARVPEVLNKTAFARQVLANLKGTHEQVPPAYSAISVNGKRAYALAREGKQVRLRPRTIEIIDAKLLSLEPDERELFWDCLFTVSKGTYIRSIARDLGESLNTAACLSGLRRTSVGPITLRDAHTLKDIEQAGALGIENFALDPVSALQVPAVELSDQQIEYLLQGKVPQIDTAVADGSRIAFAGKHKLWGVWECKGTSLKCVANFMQGIVGVA